MAPVIITGHRGVASRRLLMASVGHETPGKMAIRAAMSSTRSSDAYARARDEIADSGAASRRAFSRSGGKGPGLRLSRSSRRF